MLPAHVGLIGPYSSLSAHDRANREEMGPGPPTPKIPIGAIYASPELFPGQILAIHIQTFGKIIRRAILIRTFAFPKIPNTFPALFYQGNTLEDLITVGQHFYPIYP